VIGNAVHVMRIARVQSSRRLEREPGRKVEVMRLTGRDVPNHKTIAEFRKDNGCAIRHDKMVALLKDTTGRDAGLSQRPKTSLLSRGGGNAAQRRRAIAH